MKRFYLCITLLCLSLLIGCSKKTETPDASAQTTAFDNASSPEYIKELNENSHLGMELNQDSGLTEKEAGQYGYDHPYVINHADKETNYYCFKSPYSEAPLSVTQIEILNEEFDVYGIHLGDSTENSSAILKSYGYIETTYPLNNMSQYTKGAVNIILGFEEDIIQRIVVSLQMETEEGVMY